MTEFDPTLVSAVLEADEAATPGALSLNDDWTWGIKTYGKPPKDRTVHEGDKTAASLFWRAAPILARRVMELEEEVSAWEFDHKAIMTATRKQLEGERDRAFALMAEMDALINRAREAEAIVRDLADDTDHDGCWGAVGALYHYGDECVVLKAREWVEANK